MSKAERDRAGFAGLLVVDLHVPDSRSLKDKRHHLRSIKDSLKRSGFSVSEVAFHDLWQRSQLAIGVVARNSGDIEHLLDQAARTCERTGADMSIRQRAVLSLDDIG